MVSFMYSEIAQCISTPSGWVRLRYLVRAYAQYHSPKIPGSLPNAECEFKAAANALGAGLMRETFRNGIQGKALSTSVFT